MVILVTGGAGYIGSQLIRDLAKDKDFEGETIRIFDNMQDEKYLSLMDLPENGKYEFIEGDVTIDSDLDKAIDKDVDYIVHLAALVNAPLSFERHELTAKINYWGTKNVVDFALKHNVDRFIYASTTSVYGPTNGIVTEEHECKPASPYGEFKLKGEQEVMKASKENGLGGTSLRFATVYGYTIGLRVHTVVNIFVYRAAMNMPLIVHDTGEQKRPYIHAKDVSRGIIFAIKNKKMQNGVYNLVGENASVNDIINIMKKFKQNIKIEYSDKVILNQISYEVDGSKISKLGFQPKYNLEYGIKELMDKFSAFVH